MYFPWWHLNGHPKVTCCDDGTGVLVSCCPCFVKRERNRSVIISVPCWLVSQKSRFPWWLDAPPHPYSEYHPLWLVYDQDTFSRIPDSFLWFCIHLYDPHLFGRDVRENSVHSTSDEETYNLEVEAYHVRTFHVTSKTTQFFTLPRCTSQ